MGPEQFIDAALCFPEAQESEPFGPRPLVYKVARRKMFALLTPGSGEGQAMVDLECDPDLALELRVEFSVVGPGWHMNKRHWNSVRLDGSVPDDELLDMLDHSYRLAARGLRRADRDRVPAALDGDSSTIDEHT